MRDDYRWSGAWSHEADPGRGRIERRSIQVQEDVSDCPEWLDFPGLRHVFRIRREVTCKKDGRKRKTETARFMTSLPAAEADW